MTVLTCNSNDRQNVNLNSDLLATRDRPAHYRKFFRAKLRHAALNVGFCQIDNIKHRGCSCVCGIDNYGMQTHQKRILRPGLCLFPLIEKYLH